MTRDEWLTEVNRLMVERYGITLLDAGFDEDDIDLYYSWGDEPEESEFMVAKNSLLKLAAADSDVASISEHFVGPTAVAVTYGDPVRVAKVLVDFQKKSEVFEIKGGFLDGSALGAEEVATLATLPSLQELRGCGPDVDYVGYGAIYPTTTRAGAQVCGPEALTARNGASSRFMPSDRVS